MDNVFGNVVNTLVMNTIILFVIEIDESNLYVLNMIGIGSNHSREIIIEWINQIVSKKYNASNKSSNKI